MYPLQNFLFRLHASTFKIYGYFSSFCLNNIIFMMFLLALSYSYEKFSHANRSFSLNNSCTHPNFLIYKILYRWLVAIFHYFSYIIPSHPYLPFQGQIILDPPGIFSLLRVLMAFLEETEL